MSNNNCHHIIEDNKIKEIYSNHDFITDKTVSSKCMDTDSKEALINIFYQEEQINAIDIKRRYYNSYQLIGFNSSDKVVEHSLFILKDKFQSKNSCRLNNGQSISETIHEKEKNIYASLDFKQIHLKAAWDGVIRWKLLGFEYKYPFSETDIVNHWKTYVAEVLGYNGKDYYDIIKGKTKIRDIKKEYLLPQTGQCFTDWLASKDYVQEVPMYKNLFQGATNE